MYEYYIINSIVIQINWGVSMKKCLIITAKVEYIESISIGENDYDLIICADGGHKVANALELPYDVAIGDFDSSTAPIKESLYILPREKDITDTEAALDLAMSEGYQYVDILGGLGGRFDHTMGNIGLLSKYCSLFSHLALYDGANYLFMATPSTFEVAKKNYDYLSVISYTPYVENLSLKGVKYPLSNHTLNHSTTLGVSNEILGSTASISFSSGKLLVISSKDIDRLSKNNN